MHAQKEKKADIIISLGGDDNSRIIKAIELYKNGFSQKKIILITGGTKLTRENMNHDARIKYINNLDENINFIYNPNIKSKTGITLPVFSFVGTSCSGESTLFLLAICKFHYLSFIYCHTQK